MVVRVVISPRRLADKISTTRGDYSVGGYFAVVVQLAHSLQSLFFVLHSKGAVGLDIVNLR